jgi:hypothetical protein
MRKPRQSTERTRELAPAVNLYAVISDHASMDTKGDPVIQMKRCWMTGVVSLDSCLDKFAWGCCRTPEISAALDK